MNKRERQHLLTKLKNKSDLLESSLIELRKQIRYISDEEFWPGCAICRELEFVADYIENFVQFSLVVAKDISRDHAAFEIATEQADQLLKRFEPHVEVLTMLLRREKAGRLHKQLHEAAIAKADGARSRITALISEAEFGFDRPTLSKKSMPPNADLDAWIRNCGTNNSRIAWRLVNNQLEILHPSWKVFWDRWKVVKNAPRGRPKKKV